MQPTRFLAAQDFPGEDTGAGSGEGELRRVAWSGSPAPRWYPALVNDDVTAERHTALRTRSGPGLGSGCLARWAFVGSAQTDLAPSCRVPPRRLGHRERREYSMPTALAADQPGQNNRVCSS